MQRLGGSSYNLAETQRPKLAHEGLSKQPLLPNKKDARGSHKKPGELLTALSLRAEARGLSLQTLPRPSDLGSPSRGFRQTNPSFQTKTLREGRTKSQGNS